jgi:hypothetical protein
MRSTEAIRAVRGNGYVLLRLLLLFLIQTTFTKASATDSPHDTAVVDAESSGLEPPPLQPGM